jgi:hypothetical protein
MLTDFDVLQSPDEVVKELILSAFGPQAKNRRSVIRSVQRTLKLAEERGYMYAENFMEYFRSSSQHDPRIVKRLLMGLFEYVSPDEIASISRHSV